MASFINESPIEVFGLESFVGGIAFLLGWKVVEETLLLNLLLKVVSHIMRIAVLSSNMQ